MTDTNFERICLRKIHRAWFYLFISRTNLISCLKMKLFLGDIVLIIIKFVWNTCDAFRWCLEAFLWFLKPDNFRENSFSSVVGISFVSCSQIALRCLLFGWSYLVVNFRLFGRVNKFVKNNSITLSMRAWTVMELKNTPNNTCFWLNVGA